MNMHYIFTRFNIPLPNKSDKNGQDVLTKEWYEHRHELFQKYYLPSIACQICQDFKVLLAFDPKYPEHWKPYIGIKNIIIIHEWPNKWLQEQRLIFKGLGIKSPAILTSRVDNDDFLEPKFVEEVQKAAEELGPECLIDTHGRVVDEDENLIRVYKSPIPNSPFVSVYSKELDVYSNQHTHIYRDFEKTRIIAKPLFNQIIHKRNLSNR